MICSTWLYFLHVQVVLRDLAKIHAVHLNKMDILLSCDWLEKLKLLELQPLWGALLKHGHTDFPELWTKERCSSCTCITPIDVPVSISSCDLHVVGV